MCVSPLQHDEVDILGLDGHIYKGRMDTRLPGILVKDSEYPGSPEAFQSLLWVPRYIHVFSPSFSMPCPEMFMSPEAARF